MEGDEYGTTSSTLAFIKQDGVSTANPQVQRALGCVALCPCIPQLCAVLREPCLINPDSNQLPDTCTSSCCFCTLRIQLLIPNHIILLAKEGRIPTENIAQASGFQHF